MTKHSIHFTMEQALDLEMMKRQILACDNIDTLKDIAIGATTCTFAMKATNRWLIGQLHQKGGPSEIPDQLEVHINGSATI